MVKSRYLVKKDPAVLRGLERSSASAPKRLVQLGAGYGLTIGIYATVDIPLVEPLAAAEHLPGTEPVTGTRLLLKVGEHKGQGQGEAVLRARTGSHLGMFLICWVSIWGSAFFTAIGRGLASGLIASLRTLVFGSLAVLCLPESLGLDGVWLGWSATELACHGVSQSIPGQGGQNRRGEEG